MTHGNNTWSHTPNTTGTFLVDDLGGTDWLTFGAWNSNYLYDMFIDIRPGSRYNPIEYYNYNYIVQISSRSIIENVVGGWGNDRIVGNDYVNWIIGNDGNDRIWALGGNDTLSGNAGSDTLRGGNGNDFLSGDAGVDYLYGESGFDILGGGDGRDYLYGGDHGDTLGGGGGSDLLWGGAGADSFQFNEVLWRQKSGFVELRIPNGETPVNAPDYIYDFQNPGAAFGDVIDLSLIDANFDTIGINDSFAFYGTGVTGGALRSLWLRDDAAQNTVVYGNTSGGYAEDFKIVIVDGAGVVAANYSVHDFVL